MKKVMISMLALLIIGACKNNPKTNTEKGNEAVAAKSYTWAPDEENEFMSGCVDSAKTKIGEAAAYAQCKCILSQLKTGYPSMDSAAPALMDVKYVAQLAEKCKEKNTEAKK
jgi:hypothetical protein